MRPVNVQDQQHLGIQHKAKFKKRTTQEDPSKVHSAQNQSTKVKTFHIVKVSEPNIISPARLPE